MSSVKSCHQRVLYSLSVGGGGVQVLAGGPGLGQVGLLLLLLLLMQVLSSFEELQTKEKGNRGSVRCRVLHLERKGEGILYLQVIDGTTLPVYVYSTCSCQCTSTCRRKKEVL